MYVNILKDIGHSIFNVQLFFLIFYIVSVILMLPNWWKFATFKQFMYEWPQSLVEG